MRLHAAAILGMALLLAFPAAANDLDVETLAGLPGLAVLVEHIPDGSPVTRDEISVIAELALRSSGIRVLTLKEALHSRAGAYLYLRVSLGAPRSIQLYSINLDIRQAVTLANGKRAFGAATWTAPAGFGIASPDLLNSTIRQSLAPMLERACNDFLKANPSPPLSARPVPVRKRDPRIEEVDPEPVADVQP
ncbi:MAG: hypothetical protein EOO71_04690 [Myxococcaceae bacterium]|nr:MAG: hypothetical protein EOO71_04690 [Myxococcaceae bacterium]